METLSIGQVAEAAGVAQSAIRYYERLGVLPEQCVYVDDLPFNLPPAQELGMATIHHVDTPATIVEMERLLGLELGAAA